MGATGRKFSREIKLEAVRRLEAGRRLGEVVRELGGLKLTIPVADHMVCPFNRTPAGP